MEDRWAGARAVRRRTSSSARGTEYVAGRKDHLSARRTFPPTGQFGVDGRLRTGSVHFCTIITSKEAGVTVRNGYQNFANLGDKCPCWRQQDWVVRAHLSRLSASGSSSGACSREFGGASKMWVERDAVIPGHQYHTMPCLGLDAYSAMHARRGFYETDAWETSCLTVLKGAGLHHPERWASDHFQFPRQYPQTKPVLEEQSEEVVLRRCTRLKEATSGTWDARANRKRRKKKATIRKRCGSQPVEDTSRMAEKM
ncbi:uncharacterized protein MYCGRDRAFT_97767 [Zymoseptoria tritici IPO323]|uniref:Uncharacterized protein n=1 Tax=Zymoseptoria tritici (strain CBS 115943 / IPO323) TaxID=336722 RepID=F9XRB2_ZYMTI|nr:uncharacterized protein MYCGRDRAFT_97767 [Zymoseptoria tritici IPO323]EGP82238.1 hypothetical protein MYCGRDRAFT_97767 [Zymoseptoria tritici IPO323]